MKSCNFNCIVFLGIWYAAIVIRRHIVISTHVIYVLNSDTVSIIRACDQWDEVVNVYTSHSHTTVCTDCPQNEQEFVRPRWPYDMRPSARAEKYGCRQCVPKSTYVSL